MFNILNIFKKTDKVVVEAGDKLYRKAYAASRAPVFYADMSVLDNIDGHFEIIVLHQSLIMHRLHKFSDRDQGEEIGQIMFDVFARHMDQSLREKGVGDMGVPKHMKRMLKAFNGHHIHYQAAFAGRDEDKIKDVLSRNVFRNEGENVHIELMKDYVLGVLNMFDRAEDSEILAGAFEWPVKQDQEMKKGEAA